MTHHPLMQYYDAPGVQPVGPQGLPAQASGAAKYRGAIADGYDAKREQSPKWTVEQKIIEGMLADLPAGATVLDCPVGTGRFLDFYARHGLRFVGLDISGDMLVQSALKLLAEPKVAEWVAASNQKNTILPLRIQNRGMLAPGDIRQVPLADKSVDAAVACRITRWLSPQDCQQMLRELQRVARKRIILTARIANHPHARTHELFEAALTPDWKLSESAAGYITDYRIIRFDRAA